MSSAQFASKDCANEAYGPTDAQTRCFHCEEDVVNVTAHAKMRYTAKAFDSTRRIPETVINELRELLRNSPSSANSQPWHFFVASNFHSKARIAKSTEIAYPFNYAKIVDASHVVVMCARESLEDSHLNEILRKEEQDGRFSNPEAMTAQRLTRQSYVNLHRRELKDLQHWMEKQVYLALGMLLLAAAGLKIDTCPMEGFDARVLDEELGLRAKGLTSVIVVCLGYSGRSDFNAKLPKSRLAPSTLFTDI